MCRLEEMYDAQEGSDNVSDEDENDGEFMDLEVCTHCPRLYKLVIAVLY